MVVHVVSKYDPFLQVCVYACMYMVVSYTFIHMYQICLLFPEPSFWYMYMYMYVSASFAGVCLQLRTIACLSLST